MQFKKLIFVVLNVPVSQDFEFRVPMLALAPFIDAAFATLFLITKSILIQRLLFEIFRIHEFCLLSSIN